MMFNLPSALAAATSASIPPQADADVAVLAVDSLHVAEVLFDVPPQAATTKTATTDSPRWRVRPRILILTSPQKRPGAQAGRPGGHGNHALPGPTLQGHSSLVRLISVRPRL